MTVRRGIVLLAMFAAGAAAQPVIQALEPAAVTAGAASFTLSVKGSGFAPGLRVQFGATPLATLFAGPQELRAEVPAWLVAYPATIPVGIEAAGMLLTEPREFPVAAALSFVTRGALAPGGTGSLYQQALVVTGGIAPYRFEPASGILPPGVSLDGTSGLLVGVPSQPGQYSFAIRVSDAGGGIALRGFTIEVGGQPAISATAPARGIASVWYSQTLEATGGMPPYAGWRVVEGSLPPGLVLSTAGLVAGTPATAGTFPFTVTMRDAAGSAATRAFTMEVVERLTLPAPGGLSQATVGEPWTLELHASGGAAPYEWMVTDGTLPAGVALEGPTGLMHGTLEAPCLCRFMVRVSDALGQIASSTLELAVAEGLRVATPAVLPDGVAGSGYEQVLVATGGSPPYRWRVTAGELPQGLALDAASGRVSGVTASAGTFQAEVKVTDAGGRSASRTVELTIVLPAVPPLRITGLPAAARAAEQIALAVELEEPYPVDLEGVLRLGCETADAAVQFSTGGRTAAFRIAAGERKAVFEAPVVVLQTGTSAGRITLAPELDAQGMRIHPQPAGVELEISASPPVLSLVRAERTAAGFDVIAAGFSTTRELGQAVFRFTGAAGADLRTAEVAVDLTAEAAQWFGSAEAAPAGGLFLYRQSFTVQGDPAAAQAVAVELRNTAGKSAGAAAKLD